MNAHRLALLAPSLLAAAVMAGCMATEAEQPPVTPPAPAVTTAEVVVRELTDWADFTGRLEAAENVDVRPRVGGYVDSVHFEEGSRVAAGDLLFRIDARPFEAEVNRLEAELDRARAEVEVARSYAERAERLLAENATSREEVERSTADAAVAEATLEAVEAALETAQLNLSFTRVTAPISGRVSRAFVTAGNLVDASTLLTSIVGDEKIYAYFDADEHTYLDLIRGASGEKAYVGLANEQGYPHVARLDFVDNRVDPDQGTIRARAVLDNADGVLTPGLFARVRVVGRKSYAAALVDQRAIGTDLDRSYVLVVDDADVAQYRGVELGRTIEHLRIVTAGLHAGDDVIVNGLQRVRPGAPVAASEVAMKIDAALLERLAAGGAARSGPAAPHSGRAASSESTAGRSGSDAALSGSDAALSGSDAALSGSDAALSGSEAARDSSGAAQSEGAAAQDTTSIAALNAGVAAAPVRASPMNW